MEKKYGEEYKGDSRFVADCRKLQSIYRVEIGEEIRPYTDRYGNVHYYGNYISNGEIPKENCWKNFLTECAFKHAEYRVENRKEYVTIESDRLFNNLLSSQPMAFNLFCPLRQMLVDSPELATKVIKAVLPDYPIHKVTKVELEFIPKNYLELTGDKSAMDAIIGFEDEQGKGGFIAVETKYSESLGTNVAYDRDENGKKIPRAKSIEAVKKLQCFTPDVEKSIIEGNTPLTQIYRNFLLSEMYGFEEGLLSYSIILAPRRHPSTKRELVSLTNGLNQEYKNKIEGIDLEDFVERIISVCPEEYATSFERFYDRYLNFDKLKNFD
ncbi:MAG: hypothetical protein IKU85_04925 [Bacteroidaceae bacterium]|nr:hypothetical protein [Bacteroidaceae bacterium]